MANHRTKDLLRGLDRAQSSARTTTPRRRTAGVLLHPVGASAIGRLCSSGRGAEGVRRLYRPRARAGDDCAEGGGRGPWGGCSGSAEFLAAECQRGCLPRSSSKKV